MIGNAFILPTGEEILDGTVLDLDCPRVMQAIVKRFPACRVTRLPPVADDEEGILAAAEGCLGLGADLLVLVGGSGGGHRHSATLGKDYSHSALERWLDEKRSWQIYGKNGHLWCSLVCGVRAGCLVVNVPGPVQEATAAINAFAGAYRLPLALEPLNEAMARAVIAQYPPAAVEG